jgi:hypothetical protein
MEKLWDEEQRVGSTEPARDPRLPGGAEQIVLGGREVLDDLQPTSSRRSLRSSTAW